MKEPLLHNFVVAYW